MCRTQYLVNHPGLGQPGESEVQLPVVTAPVSQASTRTG
jgi:hypothetical protein